MGKLDGRIALVTGGGSGLGLAIARLFIAEGARVHSFFRYAAFELPTHAAQIQRVLAIPSKRFTRTLVRFLTRPEVDALLAAPERHTWFGRRDHAFILMAVQTGLRLSEITAAKREDLVLGTGAHIRVIGKGRKERCMAPADTRAPPDQSGLMRNP